MTIRFGTQGRGSPACYIAYANLICLQQEAVLPSKVNGFFSIYIVPSGIVRVRILNEGSAVLSGLFGAVQAFIGQLNDLARAAPIIGIKGNPNTAAYRDLIEFNDKRFIQHGNDFISQLFGFLIGLHFGRTKDKQKFVPAQPNSDITRMRDGCKSLRNLLQQDVTELVTEGIVYFF